MQVEIKEEAAGSACAASTATHANKERGLGFGWRGRILGANPIKRLPCQWYEEYVNPTPVYPP